jgi:3-deoxy-D-manno-octulosonate 8-phosphate phosphatase (KDO 8-P phosphatase)
VGPLSPEALQARAAKVELVVLDVDGVLTDGGLYYGHEGEVMKRFSVKDGHAIVMARIAGLPCAILTARRSAIVEIRAKELGIRHVLQGQREKGLALDKLLAELSIAPESVAYMGDDTNDVAPLMRVGLPACPADAAPEALERAAFVAKNEGGKGAVRELLELCLKASGRWEAVLAAMLN